MKHGKMLRRGLALVLSAAMAASSAFATTLDKTATDLDGDKTTVSLSIGGNSRKENVAVLFVLDYSTSVDVRDAAAYMLDELASKDNTNVKACVINYWADQDSGEWVDISADTDTDSLLKQTQTGGTNLHGGLLAAQEALNSSEIANYETYLVLISDGITYLWTDEDTGDTMSVWFQNIGNGPDDIQNGNSVVEMKYGEATPIDGEIFDALVDGNEEVDEKYQTTISKAEKYGSAKPASTETERYWAFAEEGVKDSTLIGSEIAIYKSADTWRDLVASVDKAFALKMDENHWSSYPYGEQLMDYLVEQSDPNGSGLVTDETAATVFSGIKNEIIFDVKEGTVTDIIGNDFDFLVDTDNNSVEITVGGDPVPRKHYDEDNHTFTFGENSEYTVTYYPNGTEEVEGECLIWKINVPVTEEVVLSYDLTLVNKETTSGTHTVFTNEDAWLDYVPTEGEPGTKKFPQPDVTYTVDGAPSGGDDNDKPSGGGDNDRYEGPDLTVVKVDEDGETIESNARFRIYKEQGSKTMWYKGNQSWSEDEEDAWIFNTSVGDGSFTAYDLKPGTYYIVEISAPEGYDLAEEPLEVEVESRDVTVEFVNSGDGVVTTPTKPVPDTGR